MSNDEMDRILDRLRAGAELTVRNQDGEWGIRGTSDGFETWERVPDEPLTTPRSMSEVDVVATIGRWEFAATSAQLRDPRGWHIRKVADDEIEALTRLLNRAYAEHAARGIHMLATHQGADTTRERIAGNECFVGSVAGRLVATVTLVAPHTGRSVQDAGCPTYARPGVAKINQFAVDPDHRGRGYGRQMMDHAEKRARALGAIEMALDTAGPARETQQYYLRRGYQIVDRVDWRPDVNYESVVLSRQLAELPPDGEPRKGA